MSEKMTPLDHVIQSERNEVADHDLHMWSITVEEAALELAALRARAARADELERAANEAQDRIVDLKDVIDGVITTAAYSAGVFTITPRMYDELQMALDDDGWKTEWLAAHPAHPAQPEAEA